LDGGLERGGVLEGCVSCITVRDISNGKRTSGKGAESGISMSAGAESPFERAGATRSAICCAGFGGSSAIVKSLCVVLAREICV
jgi:hypothetical protein